ncbi:MAG: PucR family transcriptional regulator [Micrococcales bacterium]|nr:PucR family transcriptional regulator [Micrococcales bacterium]
MPITVRDILARRDLHLRTVVDGGPTALDAAVTWVVSSDLADPTPFLDRGNLLLTTGRQLDPRTVDDTTGEQRYTDDADAYVAGLRQCGVSAVGFGIRVLHTGTPPALVDACRTHAMPLFEVPYHIPFIAVIRAAADLIDAAGHRRNAWALTATSAVSAAVLQTLPVDAVLAELARQTGCGAVLIDPRGKARAVHGLSTTDPIVVAARTEATNLLRRGRRTGATMTVPFPPPAPPGHRARSARGGPAGPETAHLTMQTVGPDTGPRSVLVLAGSSALDSAEQTVVTSAVALLWFAIGEGTGAGTRASLRRALWHLLMDGATDIVRAEAPSAGMKLPAEPVRAVAWSPGPHGATMRALQAACDAGRAIVFAAVDDTVLACTSGGKADVLRSFDPGRGAGVSEPVTYANLPRAVERARRAARRAVRGGVVVLDDPAAGILATLDTTPDLVDRAHGLLHRLEEQDRRSDSGLVDALTAWLRANGSYGAAARRLGLHRHTLSARVSRAGTLLERDLDDVDTRTDLWLALRLTGRA